MSMLGFEPTHACILLQPRIHSLRQVMILIGELYKCGRFTVTEDKTFAIVIVVLQNPLLVGAFLKKRIDNGHGFSSVFFIHLKCPK